MNIIPKYWRKIEWRSLDYTHCWSFWQFCKCLYVILRITYTATGGELSCQNTVHRAYIYVEYCLTCFIIYLTNLIMHKWWEMCCDNLLVLHDALFNELFEYISFSLRFAILSRRFSRISNCAHVCKQNPNNVVSVAMFTIVAIIIATISCRAVNQNKKNEV